MERIQAAAGAKVAPKESKRRYGEKWQGPKRTAERAIRIAAVAFRRWTAPQGVPRHIAAQAIGIPERTLASWESGWRRNRLQAGPRGRGTERSPVELRNTVVAAFRLMGAHVGVPVLRVLFPEMPKRELEDMTRRYKALHARKGRVRLYALRWRIPGAVWAIDHSDPPAPVDGVYPQMLSVRDLCSGNQIAWSPVKDKTAREVGFVLEPLIIQHGPPLLIKKDNGSSLNDADLEKMLEKYGITSLLSPVGRPMYNGSCEAGIGSMKVRTNHQAAMHDRPAQWTCDDCEAARLQGNLTARPRAAAGRTPEEVWSSREPISEDLRRRFQKLVPFFEGEERRSRGYLPDIDPGQAPDPEARRAGIRRALVACGILEIRRGRFSLPISSN